MMAKHVSSWSAQNFRTEIGAAWISTVLKTSILALFVCLLSAHSVHNLGAQENQPTANQKRPNILWLIAEDMSPHLGCYGENIETPAIDRLAEEGMRYSHAYTTAPVCSTSRSAFMTGMYQTSIGAHNHRSHRTDGYQLPEGVQVITEYFKEADYFTANIRQITSDPKERFFRGTGKTDWNFNVNVNSEPFDSDKWSDLQQNQPFYAQINFSETHRGQDWDNAHKHIKNPANPDKIQFPPYYPDHSLTRSVWAQYHNAIMALDLKIDRVLYQLKTEGILENTIVVFMSDHGAAMPRSKQWPYESGLRIPLIIRWPKNFQAPNGWSAGCVDDRLVASIDLSASSLAWAGIPRPLVMQGRVFLGAEEDPERRFVFGGRDRGDETVDRIRTVRDERFRYIRNFMPERPFLQLNRYKEWSYPIIGLMRELHDKGELNDVQSYLMNPTRPTEELYDLENDPYEIHNLIHSPKHKERLNLLRATLNTWMIETNDQGRFIESEEIHQFWENQMKESYDQRLLKRAERKAQDRHE
jgi:N-sulfoglucosamine sulfohydrolase